MKFKGTIIITDPCYVMNQTNEISGGDDWQFCEYGEKMEKLGIKTYLTNDTEYGDWTCVTFEENNDGSQGQKLGDFCADSGLVSVFLLDEVRAYNPEIDKWIESHDWCVTKINDFDGDIEITHRDVKVHEYDNNYQIIEDKFTYEPEVSVVGKGNINFFTTQTGV